MFTSRSTLLKLSVGWYICYFVMSKRNKYFHLLGQSSSTKHITNGPLTNLQISHSNRSSFFPLMTSPSLEGTFLHKIQVVQVEVTMQFRYPASKAQMTLSASLLGAAEHTKDPLEYILVLLRRGIDCPAPHPLIPRSFLHSKVSMPKTISTFIVMSKNNNKISMLSRN